MVLSSNPAVFNLQLLWWIVWGTDPKLPPGQAVRRSPVETSLQGPSQEVPWLQGQLWDRVAGRSPGSLHTESEDSE